MLKSFLAGICLMLAACGSMADNGLYAPYAQSHINFLYNLLFCDDMNLFKGKGLERDGGLWGALLAEPVEKTNLIKIANDESNDGRVRAIAFNKLRASGEDVVPKRVLGVIVEVPLGTGLDVLAAFSEGGVRYLNQSGKAAFFEGQGNAVEYLAKELIAVSQPIVNRIGPSDKKRLPPPKAGNVRITFLVSDGFYFAEGPFRTMQQDAIAGPVLSKATQLLQRVVKLGVQ